MSGVKGVERQNFDDGKAGVAAERTILWKLDWV
jgi:hypothetical protein